MPRQTRKKKGGKALKLSEINNDNDNNSLKGGMENELENEFSNNNNKQFLLR